eukprot:TRINITY_DN36929_c0_g1_i1.p1 TRINITY_DN36929_c0_g1~~TRINITY_DN36929_c0_g1_i1.p1  ORF type:complete len:826 (+),score=148.63 TRINITY_DN36929_c0_g1_i1:44-2521(+)
MPGKKSGKRKRDDYKEEEEEEEKDEEEPILEHARLMPEALVSWDRSQLVTSPGMGQYSCSSMSVNSEGYVAIVTRNETANLTDYITIMDPITDPYGEYVAPAVAVKLADAEQDAGPSQHIARCFVAGRATRVSSLVWGPPSIVINGGWVIPLAFVTVDGRVGLITSHREGGVIVTKPPIYIELDFFATAVVWRPVPLDRAERKCVLAVGDLDGFITLWTVGISEAGIDCRRRSKTKAPVRQPIIALDWVTRSSWDNMVVLKNHGVMQVWGCTLKDGQLYMNLNLETSSGQGLPSPCQLIRCMIMHDERMYIYHACKNTIISYVVDEERNVSDAIVIPTVHKGPITGFTISPHCLVTTCSDGWVGVHPINGLSKEGFCIADEEKDVSPHGIVLQKCPGGQTAVSVSFTCNGSMLLMYIVKYQSDRIYQGRQNPHKLVPFFPFAAMSAQDQMKLFLLGTAMGRTSEEATFSSGGVISCVASSCLSTELRATAYEWYPAMRHAFDEHLKKLEKDFFSPKHTMLLKLSSALLHLLPPWSASTTPVTPDPAFPACTPASTTTVVRTEIIRCMARASLYKLVTLSPKNLKQQELVSALSLATLLVSVAARAATIWIPSFSEAYEPKEEGEQKVDAKLKSTDITYDPSVGAESLILSFKRSTMDLALARKVALACGASGKSLLDTMKQVQGAVKAVNKSCQNATGDNWELPQVNSEAVAEWKRAREALMLERNCSTCGESLRFDLSVHTLSEKCPEGHINQLCPATLLHLQGIDKGLMHKVCMACGTSMSHPFGHLCLPESKSRLAYAWLDIPTVTCCLICGYRLNYNAPRS